MSDNDNKSALIEAHPDLVALKRYSDARLALGRAGAGIPTKANLTFMLDHARARDSVWSTLETGPLEETIGTLGLPMAHVKSQVLDRSEYLRRPDLGRKMDPASAGALDKLEKHCDTVFVIADGLSAVAIELNAGPLLATVVPQLTQKGLSIAGVVFAEQARVAIGDDIASALDARSVIVLVGERPGLSAADSLGCYITWSPKPGTPDSGRNCISNIRPGGLANDAATAKICWLIQEMARLRLSGVGLKDDGLKSIE